MICIDYPCDRCKHQHEKLLNGWKSSCDAFPDGIPSEYCLGDIDVTKLKECNNGIGYEPKED